MQNRREKNLQRRRRNLILIGSFSGLGITAVIIGVFFGVVAILGHWPKQLSPIFVVSGEESQMTGSSEAADLQESAAPSGTGDAGSQPQENAGVNETGDAGSQPQESAAPNGTVDTDTESQPQESTAPNGTGGTDTESQPQENLTPGSEYAQTTTKAEPDTPAAVVVEIEQPISIRLVAVGDNLMHRSVSMSGLQADGSYNYDYNFSKVAGTIQAADIAVINQEAVIGGNDLGIQGYPTFNGRTEMADAVVRNGFDVVLGANNHTLDQGARGVLHMIQYFNTHYPQISLLGVHENWETRNELEIVEVQGIRLAMINYTDILNIPSARTGQEYLIDFLDYDWLAAQIQQAKASADFVIVFPHWGTEYNLGVDAKQQEQVNFLASHGVDLVIGTHPHVVEPVQMVSRPDGGRMLVYYSLGNYQSIQNKESMIIGAMADVVIEKHYGNTVIKDFNMKFLATDYRMSGGFRDYYDIVTTYPWEQYTRELAQGSWVFHDNPGFNLDYMYQLQAQMAAQVAQARAEAGF